jgi:hypothetical protein
MRIGKPIGIALIGLFLLPLGLTAQRRTTSFKRQSYVARPYISRKATTSSFAGKKFTVTPFLDKSPVARNAFMTQTNYSRRTRTTR